MSLVVVVKVAGGLAMAADTAETHSKQGDTQRIFPTARKISRLGERAGVLYYGNDPFRIGLPEQVAACREGLPPDPAGAARVLRERLLVPYREAYTQCADPEDETGFLVAGYDAKDLPRLIGFSLSGGQASEPTYALPQSHGIYWAGCPAPMNRLLLGRDDSLKGALTNALWGNSDRAESIVADYDRTAKLPLSFHNAPLGEAAACAAWLVNTAIGYYRFLQPEQVVGGTVEVATIGVHSGWSWCQRQNPLETSQGLS